MKYQLTSGGDATDEVSSPYGAPRHATDRPDDERRLYGEPHHEVGSSTSEKQFYGEPQHENVEPEELRDPELEIEVVSVRPSESVRPNRPGQASASRSGGTATEHL